MAGIRSVGWWVPEGRRSAAELARYYEIDESAIKNTGLITQTLAGPDDHPSTMGARATHAALSAAGLTADDLDLLIYCGSTRDLPSPWVAAYGVIHEMGTTRPSGFDLSNRCTSVIDGLAIAAAYIQNGAHRNVAVCCAERFDYVLGPQVRPKLAVDAVCSPGAATVIVSADAENQIAASCSRTNPDPSVPNNLKNGSAGGSRRPLDETALRENLHLWKKDLSVQNIKSIRQHAIGSQKHNIQKVCEKAGFDRIDFAAFCVDDMSFHRSELESLEIDPTSTVFTFPHLGHIGGADVLLSLGAAVAIGKDIGSRIICTSYNSKSSHAIAIHVPGAAHGIDVGGAGFDPNVMKNFQ